MKNNNNNEKLTLIRNRKLLFFLLILLRFLPIIESKNNREIISKASSISVIINLQGYHQVFSKDSCKSNSFIYPNKIYINNIENETVTTHYYLDEEHNNITLYWEHVINSTACLFNNSKDIEEIDLSNFDTSNLLYIRSMFGFCYSLTSINFKNFNRARVKDMNYLFYNCSSLRYLNLSSFNTTSVTDMGYMFAHCNSLYSLDISHFNTENIEKMNYMFLDCQALKSLDISHFITSNVLQMHGMFENDISLKYLNLSNFNISKVENMNRMFRDCQNLEYINLKNFVVKENAQIDNMFLGVAKNLVLCAEDDILINNISRPECSIIDCTDNWRENQNKLYNDQCYISCNLTINIFDYNSKCVSNCPNGTYLIESNICKECPSECINCRRGI